MLFKYSYPIITRKGVIYSKDRTTENQCKQKGHDVYHYELATLFVNEIKLDENQFIIDHQLIDDAVQAVDINSCEIMSKQILSNIQNLFYEKGIKYIGIKLKIQPAYTVPENGAHFRECVCSNPKDLPLILGL